MTARWADRLADCMVALLAVALSWVVRDELSTARQLLLWPMSVIVAWRCGFGPVTVASLFGAILWEVFIGASFTGVNVFAIAELASMAVYVGVSMAIGYTVDRLRRERLRVALATNGMTDAMLVVDAR